MPGRSPYRRLRHWVYAQPFIQDARRRRYRFFETMIALTETDRILDIGASDGTALEVFNTVNPIVAVDIREDGQAIQEGRANVTFMVADGTRLPFPDRSFDIVFCNSVIEHVWPEDRRQRLATEIRRVGVRYYVQTPNQGFPLEPHYLLPAYHYLPRALRHTIDRRNYGGRTGGPIELLSAKDLGRLFPDADIHRERVGCLTKSLMAIRNA